MPWNNPTETLCLRVHMRMPTQAQSKPCVNNTMKLKSFLWSTASQPFPLHFLIHWRKDLHYRSFQWWLTESPRINCFRWSTKEESMERAVEAQDTWEMNQEPKATRTFWAKIPPGLMEACDHPSTHSKIKASSRTRTDHTGNHLKVKVWSKVNFKPKSQRRRQSACSVNNKASWRRQGCHQPRLDACTNRNSMNRWRAIKSGLRSSISTLMR